MSGSPSPTLTCSYTIAACGDIVNSPHLTLATPRIRPPTAVIVHPLSLILGLPCPNFPPGMCVVVGDEGEEKKALGGMGKKRYGVRT